MYNQNLEFSAAAGLTLSCKLFTLGSDTVVATSTATEKVNDKNRYIASYTDIPAGAYRLNAFASGIGGFANEVYDITLSSQTFYPRSESKTALQDSFDALTERTLPSGQYLNTSSPVTVTALTQSAVEDIFSTYTLSEDYAASGQMGTPAQILYFMQQTFSQFAISGVYISVKKLDGTTEAAKFIMNDKEAPTSRTRIL